MKEIHYDNTTVMTIVTDTAKVTASEEGAKPLLEFALQMDQEAYMREATAEECLEHWEKHPITAPNDCFYSGRDPGGYEFRAYRNDKNDVITLVIYLAGDENWYEWETEVNPIVEAQDLLVSKGYPMELYG